MLLYGNTIVNIPPGLQKSIVYRSILNLQCIYENVFTVIIYNTRVYWYYSQFQWVQLCDRAVRNQFEFIGVFRCMQRNFSHICDGTDVQAD